MRRIAITKKIDSWAQEYLDQMKYCKPHNGEISQTCKMLSDLKDSIQKGNYQIVSLKDDNGNLIFSENDRGKLIEYIERMRQRYPLLLTMHPKKFDHEICDFEEIIPTKTIGRILLRKNDSHKDVLFYELIVRCMRYPYVQSGIFPEYIRRLGIKTCVYCNAQYAITTVDKEKNAFYELDHCLPKSKYPYLSANFFNLQPCCGPCNRRKQANDMKYGNYTATIWCEPSDTIDEYCFFRVKDESLAEYMVNHNQADIELEFKISEGASNEFKKLYKDYCESFRINRLYSEHKDVAEEVIWKKFAYNPALVQALRDAFAFELAITEVDVKRLIMGYYMNEEEIYKRPLSKMVQDVAEQLHIEFENYETQ